MERIAIIGCGGSGKTYLARQLAQRLSLPLTHLDGVYYDENWKTLTRENFSALQKGLVAEPRWIIEGNYASTLPVRLGAADTVIVMDLPARTCLLGILQRRLRHRGGQHQAGCTTGSPGAAATSACALEPDGFQVRLRSTSTFWG